MCVSMTIELYVNPCMWGSLAAKSFPWRLMGFANLEIRQWVDSSLFSAIVIYLAMELACMMRAEMQRKLVNLLN
ncbi:hypothetical protein VTI74DRAFT_8550 [Chaetomium olivicolor]